MSNTIRVPSNLKRALEAMLPMPWRTIRKGIPNSEYWLEMICSDLANTHRERMDELNRNLQVIAERKKMRAAKIAELSTEIMILEFREKEINTDIEWWSARWMAVVTAAGKNEAVYVLQSD